MRQTHRVAREIERKIHAVDTLLAKNGIERETLDAQRGRLVLELGRTPQ